MPLSMQEVSDLEDSGWNVIEIWFKLPLFSRLYHGLLEGVGENV